MLEPLLEGGPLVSKPGASTSSASSTQPPASASEPEPSQPAQPQPFIPLKEPAHIRKHRYLTRPPSKSHENLPTEGAVPQGSEGVGTNETEPVPQLDLEPEDEAKENLKLQVPSGDQHSKPKLRGEAHRRSHERTQPPEEEAEYKPARKAKSRSRSRQNTAKSTEALAPKKAALGPSDQEPVDAEAGPSVELAKPQAMRNPRAVFGVEPPRVSSSRPASSKSATLGSARTPSKRRSGGQFRARSAASKPRNQDLNALHALLDLGVGARTGPAQGQSGSDRVTRSMGLPSSARSTLSSQSKYQDQAGSGPEKMVMYGNADKERETFTLKRTFNIRSAKDVYPTALRAKQYNEQMRQAMRDRRLRKKNGSRLGKPKEQVEFEQRLKLETTRWQTEYRERYQRFTNEEYARNRRALATASRPLSGRGLDAEALAELGGLKHL